MKSLPRHRKTMFNPVKYKYQKPIMKPKKNGVRKVFKGVKLFLFISLSAFFLLICYIFANLDNKLLPSVLAATEKNNKTKMNAAIESATSQLINEMNLNSDDFYTVEKDKEDKIQSLSVNTILINEFCGKLAIRISDELNKNGKEKISMPIGIIFGIDAFANLGPSYTLNIMPSGSATVDYKTSFDSAGINQINFQVWLEIATEIQIINPIQKREINITRSVPLVNTFFSGEIPNSYGVPLQFYNELK